MNQQASWIWYPCDFEIWHNLKLHNRRTWRGITRPAIWKLDTCYSNVRFTKSYKLDKTETISLTMEGNGYLLVIAKSPQNQPQIFIKPGDTVQLQAGEYDLVCYVSLISGLPAVLIQGETVYTDSSWLANNYDNEWVQAGCGDYHDPVNSPAVFNFNYEEISPVKIEECNNCFFIDFGKEIFAKLKLTGVTGKGNINVFYGESKEEAKDLKNSQLTDIAFITETSPENIIFQAKGFRYATIKCQKGVSIATKIKADCEFLPLKNRASFKCSNEKLNRIWDVALYTLSLNSREFFLDGIKRDRWVWSGDAYQSFLMNYYCFFDEAINRRTMIALRGKDPVVKHINTIMDYSFYWFISIWDHYLYTGDIDFVKLLYPKMLALMEFCLERCNSDGFMEGMAGDWVFIDWADIDKDGAVCAEQILLCKSLEVFVEMAKVLGKHEQVDKHQLLYRNLKNKILDVFWCDEQGVFLNSIKDGILNNQVTRHPAILALMYDFLTKTQIEKIKENVLLNNDIPAITTPYFRFYELDALLQTGEHNYVLNEILNYWGGMLELGATSFWETYEPEKQGVQHYEMYGGKYEKSLCHAWGASPIYLLGKYFLGIKPTSPGYETYEISPHLGGLEWLEGTVPMPVGEISISLCQTKIKLYASNGTGSLNFQSNIFPKSNNGIINNKADHLYTLNITAGTEYCIDYEIVK